MATRPEITIHTGSYTVCSEVWFAQYGIMAYSYRVQKVKIKQIKLLTFLGGSLRVFKKHTTVYLPISNPQPGCIGVPPLG